MKIDSINRNEALSQYMNSTAGATAKTSPTVNISDSVELSEGAQKFSNLMKTAQESLKASGSDEELKVSDILDRMNSNSYHVSTDDVVNGILNYTPKGE